MTTMVQNWKSTMEAGKIDKHTEFKPHTNGSKNKLKTELPYNSTIPRLVILPKEMKSPSQRDIYMSMFIAALFAIGKRWKQPKHPLMDE